MNDMISEIEMAERLTDFQRIHTLNTNRYGVVGKIGGRVLRSDIPASLSRRRERSLLRIALTGQSFQI